MDWKPATVNDKGLHKIPKRWLHLHYYEAINVLFRFENSLRVFVYIVLKNSLHSGWKDCSFQVAGESKTIRAISAKRISQAENFGYLGFNIASPVMHLTSGELIDLITADAHWPKFNKYFKGGKEIIKNKLLEIGSVRNSIAHFRPVKPEDVELIKQNSRHVLAGIEECLTNAFNQSTRVPTNNRDDWHEAVKTLGTERVSIIPHTSRDEEWVDIRLTFTAPTLSKAGIGEDFYIYGMANLNTPNILGCNSDLTDYITYLTEWVTTPQLTEAFDFRVSKQVSLVFSSKILQEHSLKIATGIKQVLSSISDECDLLLQDNLARGNYIESASCNSYFNESEGKEGRWVHQYDEMWKGYDPKHPEEYWGSRQYVSDVVAGARRYPWMPEDISYQEGFMD